MLDESLEKGLTFDDVLLVPDYSDIQPNKTDISSRLTKNLTLKLPLVSAAMDTVTEYEVAVCMAQEGGIGIIHKNMSIQEQVGQVERVKRSESGMIVNPISIEPERPILEAKALMDRYRISGVPVTKSHQLVGILTNRDIRFLDDYLQPVENVMTKGKDKLITITGKISLEDARRILQENRIEKLPVVNEHYELTGLITIKDIEKKRKHPHANKDHSGRLCVGAAVGVQNALEHTQALVDAQVDVIVIDSAHGHSQGVIDAVNQIRSTFPDLEMIAGNVVTPEAAEALIQAGATGIKVGVGPGSICTTRIISGVGVPQLSAIKNTLRVTQKYDVPIISDGGVKFSGDIAKAIAAGAHCVMVGSLLAGTSESPGKVILYQGRRYKSYRGMGSLGAMKAEGGKERYFQSGEKRSKLVPEGVEGRVPYRGPLSDTLYQLAGGLRSGMGYTGSRTIEDLRQGSRFMQITSATLRENHVHDVFIVEEAPNYPADHATET